MWYWNYQNFFFVILYENKQCFSTVLWPIVAVSQYFVALHAQHFPSRFANAQLEEKCWAFRQQNIVTRLQWALIQLRNIAYSHKEWQRKNSDNFNITIVIVTWGTTEKNVHVIVLYKYFNIIPMYICYIRGIFDRKKWD